LDVVSVATDARSKSRDGFVVPAPGAAGCWPPVNVAKSTHTFSADGECVVLRVWSACKIVFLPALVPAIDLGQFNGRNREQANPSIALCGQVNAAKLAPIKYSGYFCSIVLRAIRCVSSPRTPRT